MLKALFKAPQGLCKCEQLDQDCQQSAEPVTLQIVDNLMGTVDNQIRRTRWFVASETIS